jgi:plasmid stabilization system protein ParE
VPLALEYLDAALEEAEAAAHWYAERSEAAAAGFAAEIETSGAWLNKMGRRSG